MTTSRFREVVMLGRGGMGEVYLAVSHGLGGFRKLQVLKRLRPEFAENTEFLKMFLDEARLAARLLHPNIVQTNEVGVDDRSYFIAMEFLEGQSLHAILREARKRGFGGTPQPPSEDSAQTNQVAFGAPSMAFGAPSSANTPIRADGRAPDSGDTLTPLQRIYLKAIAETCAGLHYAHELTDHAGAELRIVHRDVSPGNVFVTYDGVVKVLDFGIAKAADSTSQTQVGVLKGKIPFMAPEAFMRKGKELDRRVDIYACGAMLWDAAVGERLWKGMTDLEIVNRLSQGQIPSPRERAPETPPRLEEICMKALAFDKDKRYATAEDLRVDIEDFLLEVGPISSREIGKFVSELYASKRKEAKTIIEQRMRAISDESQDSQVMSAAGPVSARSVPTVPPPQRGRASLPDAQHTLVVAQPHALHAAAGGSLGSQPASPAARPSLLSAPHILPPELPLWRRPIVVAAALAAVAILVGAVAFRWTSDGVQAGGGTSPSSSLSATGAPRPSAQPSAAPHRVEVFTLTLFAEPSLARFTLDDAPLQGTNPLVVRLPADGKTHVIQASAKGYESSAQAVIFSSEDQEVRFSLTKKRK